MVALTVRELVAELATGPIEDFDQPAEEVMVRRGFLPERQTDPLDEAIRKWRSGAGITVITAALKRPGVPAIAIPQDVLEWLQEQVPQ